MSTIIWKKKKKWGENRWGEKRGRNRGSRTTAELV